MSGRISIQICIAGAAALLVSGIGTNLQATTRANDCLAAPNASAPRGQHWYHRIDLPNNRKCWYLHATLMHRAAKASEFHAVSVAAGTPVSGSRADSAPGLPHTRMLSVKPQPTSLVSAIAEEPIRTDQPWAPQENGPQGSALQVDGSKPTDAVAASSRAAAKPIQQSDAPWAPRENGPQGSALGDGTKPTDAIAASSPAAATPTQQSDAPWAPQESGPQGSAPQFDRSKPTDAVAASSPAPATFRVAAADAELGTARCGRSSVRRRWAHRGAQYANHTGRHTARSELYAGANVPSSSVRGGEHCLSDFPRDHHPPPCYRLDRLSVGS